YSAKTPTDCSRLRTHSTSNLLTSAPSTPPYLPR
ncbi:hypothetical protein JMJ77_0011430, partial [Colletotrichum scovillei]